MDWEKSGRALAPVKIAECSITVTGKVPYQRARPSLINVRDP